MREAKQKTSWARHNEPYESAVGDFINSILQSTEFLETFLPFQRTTAHFGMLNGLSQTLIKLTVPGVPDAWLIPTTVTPWTSPFVRERCSE